MLHAAPCTAADVRPLAAVIAATFGMNNATAVDMDVPTSDFIANSDAACMQRCGMTAPAAAPTVGVSTAGK